MLHGYLQILCQLIIESENDAAGGRFAGNHALAGFGSAGDDVGISGIGEVGQRDTTDGCFGLVLDALLGFGRSVPMRKDESAFLQLFFELVVTIHLTGVGDAEIKSFGKQVLLNLLQ